MQTFLRTLVAATTVAAVSAQIDPLALASDGLTVPLHRNAEGELWVVGDHYKASFDQGLRFIPYLGMAYANNQEFAWRTDSMRIGSRELLAPASQPVVATGPEHCSLQWPNGVIERYLLRPEGVEQTFWLPERPQGDGELVIAGKITTPLTTHGGEDLHGPLHFHAADGGHVLSYGAAVAIDANGDWRAMRTRWLPEGRIELVVDADFLAAARFPVLVDPVVSPIVMTTGRTVQNTDIYFDTRNSATFVAYSRLASASDGDIYLRRVGGRQLGTGTVVYSDVTTAADSRRPSVAGNLRQSRVGLAYQRHVVGQSTSVIAVHSRSSTDTAVATNYRTVWSRSGRQWTSPVIGGRGNEAMDGRVLIAFEEDDRIGGSNHTDVKGHLFDLMTGQAVGDDFLLSRFTAAQSNVDCSRVRVNRSNGADDDGWMVVYQRLDQSRIDADWRIVCARVSAAGVLQNTQLTIQLQVSQHKLNPFVDGRDGEYRVGFVTLPVVGNLGTATTQGNELWTARISWSNQVGPQLTDARACRRMDGSRRLVLHGIAQDVVNREIVGLAYVDYSAGPLRCATVGSSGELLRDEMIRSGGSHYGVAMTALANPRRFVVSATNNDGTGSVFLAGLEQSTVPTAVRIGSNCSPAGLFHRSENRIGNRSFGLHLAGGQPSQPTWFLFALAQQEQQSLQNFGMPGCHAAIDLGAILGSQLAISDAQGNVELPFSLSAPVALPEVHLYLQAVQMAPGANSAGLLVTQTLSLPLGR